MAKDAGRLAKYMTVTCMAIGFCTLAPPSFVHAAETAGFTASMGDYLNTGQSDFQIPETGDSGLLLESPQNPGIGASILDTMMEDAADVQALETAADVDNNAVCGYMNLGIANVKEYVNIRKGAGKGYKPVGQLPDNAGCEILETKGKWSKIKSGDIIGWVKSKYLLTGDDATKQAEKIKTVKATATTNGVNIREKANMTCDVENTLDEGESLKVVEDLGEWVKVKQNGEESYVYSELVDVTETLPVAKSMEEIEAEEARKQREIEARQQSEASQVASPSTPSTSEKPRTFKNISKTRTSLVNYALQFVGNPYVWGGTSLTHGADCSGFVMKIYEKYGISLPHHAASQAGYGKSVSTSNMKPGDLIFYGSGGIGHVAIYIGNNQVVHASNRRTGIKVSTYNYRTPVKIVSLLD